MRYIGKHRGAGRLVSSRWIREVRENGDRRAAIVILSPQRPDVLRIVPINGEGYSLTGRTFMTNGRELARRLADHYVNTGMYPETREEVQ